MEKMTPFEKRALELLSTILSEVRGNSNKSEEEKMTREDVKAYLGIGETTYKLRVKDGSLNPRKLPGGHLYYKSELIEAREQSVRKGKI